ncbi:MAG TPA: hypothetical protein VLM37_04890 [Fibrobacteraceae bacterium]|nr:hypothetical protein [Fibrobacteraceae bacterium]
MNLRFIRMFLTLLILTGFPLAKDLTVEATGYGINQNDATTAAKREALAQGIGQLLTSQTEVENFMVKRDLILTQTMGHVKSFSVLSSKQGPDGAWEVRIRAQVSKSGLSKDLAALKIMMQTIGNPRVAVLISETNIDNNATTANKAEMTLLDFLKSKDFRVVDPSQALRFRESSDGVKAMGGDPNAISKLGSLMNAEVIIVGTAIAKEADVSNLPAFAKSGMKSASATVSFKAYNVTNREILAAKSANGAMPNINVYTAGTNAIEKAVKTLLTEKGGFFDALVESWRRGANDGSNYTVTVHGVNDFASAKAIKQAITAVVSNLNQRNFAKPLLELEVTRGGSADDLAEALDGLKTGAGVLNVEGVQGQTLNISVR